MEVLYFGGSDRNVSVRLSKESTDPLWKAVETRESVDIDLGIAGKFKAEIYGITYVGNGEYDVCMHRTTPVEHGISTHQSPMTALAELRLLVESGDAKPNLVARAILELEDRIECLPHPLKSVPAAASSETEGVIDASAESIRHTHRPRESEAMTTLGRSSGATI